MSTSPPTTSAPTTAAPTTLAPTTLATTSAPTTTLTTLAPTTTLTTSAPTTAVPDVNIDAGPIEVVVSINNYLHYSPAAPRDTTLDARLSVDPIEIELDILGEQFHKWINAGAIDIVIGIAPDSEIDIGEVISAGSINITISLKSYGIIVEGTKCNWVRWSKIGYLDFTKDESNVAGERPLDWYGCVYKILKLGDRSIAYGENGVTALFPSGINWGMKNISKVGLLGPNAVVGNEAEHYFIDLVGDMYKLSDKLERLGYSEYLSNLTNPVMSLDLKESLIYICDGNYGYVYSISTGALGEGPVNITGLAYKDGILGVVAPETIDTPKLNICTGVYDLSTRKFKTIHSVEVGTDLTEHLMVSLDYRVKNRDSFTQIDWFLVNPDGVAYPVCYGVEFRIRLKSYIYEYLEIDYLKINGAIHNYSYRDYLSGLR